MSTNSTINVYDPQRKEFKQLYAHWDGYYEWAGLMLLRYYRQATAVSKLLASGAVSSYGAPLWHLGITPEIVQSNKLYDIKMRNDGLNKETVGKLLFEINGYNVHYFNEPCTKISAPKMLANLQKCTHAYDYCYINDWWYVSENIKGTPKLIPLTYALCGYTSAKRSHNNNILDIVVRDVDTGKAFTYDYYTYNENKFESARELQMPSVRLINKIALELVSEIKYYGGYRGMLRHIANDGCNKSMRYGCVVTDTVSEAPWLQLQQTCYFKSDMCGTPHYAVLQAPMPIITDVCSAGVQLMVNVSAKAKNMDLYCRINVPEFESTNLLCSVCKKLVPDDFVRIDGVHWVKVSSKLWSQAEYKAFIDACDAVIKERHSVIPLEI